MSILLALFAALSWGVSDFLGGFQAAKNKLINILVFSMLAGLVLAIGAVLVFSEGSYSDQRLYYAIPSGVFAVLALGNLYRAISIGPVIVVAPIAAIGAAIPVIWSLLLGDNISVMGMVGILLALIGATFAAFPSDKEKDKTGGKTSYRAWFHAAIAAVSIGLFLIFLHEASTADPYIATAYSRIVSTIVVFLALLFTLLYKSKKVKKYEPLGYKGILIAAAVGFTDILAEIFFSVASVTGNVGVVSVLASLYPVVTIFIAAIVYKEKINLIPGIGAFLALLGIVFISLNS